MLGIREKQERCKSDKSADALTVFHFEKKLKYWTILLLDNQTLKFLLPADVNFWQCYFVTFSRGKNTVFKHKTASDCVLIQGTILLMSCTTNFLSHAYCISCCTRQRAVISVKPGFGNTLRICIPKLTRYKSSSMISQFGFQVIEGMDMNNVLFADVMVILPFVYGKVLYDRCVCF